MKILYGIQTTGNGHISRSREVVRELKKLGHEVQVLFSGSKPEMQSDFAEFDPYQLFKGLTFCTKQGRLKYFQTAIQLNFIQFYPLKPDTVGRKVVSTLRSAIGV